MKNVLADLTKKAEAIGKNEKLREVIMYLFFGGLTSIISIVLYAMFFKSGLSNLFANGLSLFFAILFAFLTNRKWVFRTNGAFFFKECCSFYLGRLATAVLEMLIMYAFVDILAYNNFVMKVIATVIVVIINYILSKFFVFKT